MKMMARHVRGNAGNGKKENFREKEKHLRTRVRQRVIGVSRTETFQAVQSGALGLTRNTMKKPIQVRRRRRSREHTLAGVACALVRNLGVLLDAVGSRAEMGRVRRSARHDAGGVVDGSARAVAAVFAERPGAHALRVIRQRRDTG